LILLSVTDVEVTRKAQDVGLAREGLICAARGSEKRRADRRLSRAATCPRPRSADASYGDSRTGTALRGERSAMASMRERCSFDGLADRAGKRLGRRSRQGRAPLSVRGRPRGGGGCLPPRGRPKQRCALRARTAVGSARPLRARAGALPWRPLRAWRSGTALPRRVHP